MADTELQQNDGTAWLEAMATGKITARDLLERHIAQIAELNPALNAVVQTDFERARAAADAADEARAAGKALGPLHGLPMTVKDALEVEGVISTGGSPDLKNHRPAKSAVAVQRLQAAGAIVMGKTNVPNMSADMQTYNDVYGVTNNPWDLSRTPGGSSGGACAALAAGMTSIEIGSDIGGSIRSPAHYCGVVGHKTTQGLVPKIGHVPPRPGIITEDDLSVIGPLARSVRDAELMLPVVAGAQAHMAKGWRLDFPAPRKTSLKGLRVAVWTDDPFAPVSNDTKAVHAALAKAMAAEGAEVDMNPPLPMGLEELMKVYMPMLASIIFADFPPALLEQLEAAAAAAPAEDTSFSVLQGRGANMRHRERMMYVEQQAQIRARYETLLQSYDVLLTPVTPDAAFAHCNDVGFTDRKVLIDGVMRDYTDFLYWSGPAILMGLPSTSIRAGFSASGLPIGVQVVGGYLEDRTCLAVAGMIEQLTGGFKAPSLDFAS